jgi:hypothetical protein
VAIFHLIVLTGLGIMVSGASAFKGVNFKPSTLVFLKVGIIILLLAWVVLWAWSLFSLLPSQRTVSAPGFVGGTKVRHTVPSKREELPTYSSVVVCCAVLPSLHRYPNDV